MAAIRQGKDITMSNNNEGAQETNFEQICPFWKEPCSKVCPTCPLWIEIASQQNVLGVLKVVKQRLCYFPASAMIMSTKPVPPKQPPPLVFGRG